MKKEFVRLKGNQTILEKENEIVITKNIYRVVPDVEQTKVFEGKVLPLPFNLIFFLKPPELKVFSLIYDQIRMSGHCTLTNKEINRISGISEPVISQSITHMKKLGLIYIKVNGYIQEKKIDYRVIQRLEKLCNGLDFRAAHLYRKYLGDNASIYDITVAIRGKVKNDCTPKDPIELEEYK